jgi:V8-like Glu-specific endopeptidase
VATIYHDRNQYRLRSKMRSASLLCLVIGCGAAESDGDAVGPTAETAQVPEENGAPVETLVDLGDVFKDHAGRAWVKTRKVTYSTAKVLPPSHGHADENVDSDAIIANSPVEEVARKLASVMEFGGFEYALSASDALKEAKEIQAAVQESIRSGKPPAAGSSHKNPNDREARPGNKIIIGSDNRTNGNSFAEQVPTSGWVAALWQSCTGFKMLNDFTMVTAAHCVYDTVNNAWLPRTEIQLGAGSNNGGTGHALGKLTSGCYTRHVTQGWIDRADPYNEEFDYAVFKLRGDTATCVQANFTNGFFGYQGSTNGDSGLNTRLEGYPGGTLPTGWTYPTLGYQYCSGCGSAPSTSYVLRYTNDATPGQSGAPVYIWWAAGSDYRVKAIHHGTDSTTYNTGARITSTMINWMITKQGF